MGSKVAVSMLWVASLIASASAGARDGDLDRGFGTAGKVFVKYTAWFIDTYNIELALQPDGKMLLGSSRNFADPDYDFGVMRLMPDGTVDSTFGSSGQSFVVFDRTGSDKGDHLVGVVVQPDGKIVLAGVADGDTSTGQDMAIARLNSDGSLDTGFGTSGKTIVPFNLGNCTTPTGCDDVALRVNLQADNKILLAGQAASNPDATTFTSAFAITRLTTTGQRDSTFDIDGRVTLTFGTGDLGRGFRAKQLADGTHILVVGGANTTPAGTNADFALARLNDNGSLDMTFGVGGKVTYGFDIGGDLGDIATDFVELPDGKLMVCGEVKANNPSNYDFGCIRFLANGTVDITFPPVLIPFDIGGGFQDAPLRLERDSRGRFLLIGFAERVSGSFDFAAARLLPDGSLDTSFGHGGTLTYDSLPATGVERNNGASGLAVQPDGKIVIAGYADSDGAGHDEFEVVRVIGDTIFSDGFEGS
jgi:uncharacterized delta-60 repeat protein